MAFEARHCPKEPIPSGFRGNVEGHVRNDSNITVWAISDGRTGNRRQVQALLRALRCEAREFCVELAGPWRWLAPHLRWPWAQALPREIRAALHAPPELVVGCGRASASITAMLRAHVPGCRAIQILDPRIAPKHFDWVIAPAHDGLTAPNCIETLGAMTAVDETWLTDAAHGFPDLAAAPSPRLAVLIGGAHRDWTFDVAALERLLEAAAQWQLATAGSVWLTSSRRTPVQFEARLTAFADAPGRKVYLAPGQIPARSALSVGTATAADLRNPYPGFLALSDALLVTADSVNLASEACATGRPVFVFESARTSGKLARFHAALAARGHARDGARLLDPELPGSWPPPLREAAAVAAMLSGRITLSS